MGIKDKIVKILNRSLEPEYIRLDVDGDDAISGFVISQRFEGLAPIDRQSLIEQSLTEGEESLTPEEFRRVLMIAGFTPVEYETIGARIRVHKVRQKGNALEVVLHGCLADAEYVRGALSNQKGVQTTEPKSPPGALGVLITFTASGTKADPLTKQKAIRILERDPYIEVMANA